MSNIATQTIDVDLTPGGVSPFLYVSQGDYGTRNLSFSLYLNGQSYAIPSTVTTISLEGVTKGGNLFNVTCTFTSGSSTVVASLTADMTADVGLDICQLKFTTGTTGILGTANFFIVVEKSPSSVKVLYGNVYWSELSKSWAIGGTDLRSDESTNNSNYWSTISKSWAIGETGKRTGEETNNAKYYSTVLKNVIPELNQAINKVNSLQSQINQYVKPSTQQPDEVVNARVGYDGTTYPTLGEAIRAQVTVYGYIPGSEEIYIRHNE